ncbi:hypothetical protein GH714_002802 [Hevea brasiliensis]|uniref:PGG domain-containing protein n=1 Tax=Hevea brasiliensis TaxID=3981 RepID=A0A6A6MAD6_HEVBR|nr:hypothetical protein GH714_002802 [Hevea brasiliensis]
MSTASIKCNHRICPHRGDNLTEAAERGRFDRFNEHLDHLDFIVTPNGNTILHIHLSRQREISTDFIEQVVVQCPRLLSQENFDGNTPLHIAASHGYTNVAEKLIRLAEALHDALDSRRREVAINILQNEVEAAERANRVVREMLRKVNEKGETALHVAARNGRSLGVLKAILSKEDPQFAYPVNNLGESPLYLAVDSTCTKIVAELLNNPNSQSLEYDRLYGRYDETVLHTAVRRWDTEIVRMLLEKQSSLAKKEDGRGKTPLHYAAYEGYGSSSHCSRSRLKHTMNEIISKRPDCCKLTDTEGKNVLHYAVYSRHEEVLKAILEKSSLISLIIEKDNNGNTPVHVFKALNLPLSSFILDGDTDAFILWKKLYCSLPEDFTIENSLLWSNEDHFKVTKRHPERKTEMAKKREEQIILQLEKAKDSHLVAAALVATVTFAAAFTLPGGYISDEKDSGKGTPILIKNSAFKAFIISDALAMALSTSSVFIYFIMVMLGYGPKYYWLIKLPSGYLPCMGAMVVAFATGTYAVLAPSLGLAISTCAIGLSFFFSCFMSSKG